MEELIVRDHQITIREVVDDVSTSPSLCHEIFSSVLGTCCSKICSKSVEF